MIQATMNLIADFLLTRVAEDEAECHALAAHYPYEAADTYWRANSDDIAVHVGIGRGLAECKAKRSIVVRCSEHLTSGGGYDDDALLAEATIRALGAPYAAHPDYRAEWA